MPLQLLKKAATCVGQDCVLCGGPSDVALVCGACDARLPRCSEPLPTEKLAFDHAITAFDYAFPVDRLVQRFKFAGDLAVGRWLAEQLTARVRTVPRPALLVAPPLTASRLRERGFNQALEMARVVGGAIGTRVAVRGLVKVRETVPQPSLGGGARRRNLRGAFACSLRLDGIHVAIVDDVLTTGATGDALAQARREAGAARVSLWAVARAPDPRR
jgi:ComF family protein